MSTDTPTHPDRIPPDPTSPAVVVLTDAVAVLGDFPALAGATLAVDRGEIVLLRGPNGAGKTTLLRLCAGLVPLTRGSGSVAGYDLTIDREAVRRRVGLLGHQNGLYRDLTVSENLRFHARLHGIEAPGRRIAELLERVGMARREDELARNLSAGMAQRVAVCRAVLHDPELMLLDEPHAHLDPEASALVEPLIGPAAGRTRVSVTHDFRTGLAGGGHALALGHGGTVAYRGPAAGLEASEAEAIYRGSPQ